MSLEETVLISSIIRIIRCAMIVALLVDELQQAYPFPNDAPPPSPLTVEKKKYEQCKIFCIYRLYSQ